MPFAVSRGPDATDPPRLLVVEDEAIVAMDLVQQLSELGYRVCATADNADDALNLVDAHAPDLVLMDVVMPGMNGFQATRQLSRDPETQKIPVIMCTTKSQETDRVWGMRQGAVEYVVKPVMAEVLLGKIVALG